LSFASIAPGAIVAAAAQVIPGAGLIAALPGLIGGLIAGPTDPRGGFNAAASIPEGTDFRVVFGLDPGISGPPRFNPFEHGKPGGGFSLPGIFRAAFDQSQGIGPAASQLAANQALSFVPSVAAIGEAKLQAILDAPVVLPTFRANNPIFRGFNPERFKRLEVERRQKQNAGARTEAIKQARTNQFFAAVASASAQGLLPGTQTSAATFAAFGAAPGPIQRVIAPVTPAPQPPAATAIAAPLTPQERVAPERRPPASPITEARPMATVPTGGLFSGFAEGLGGLIQAATPLLGAILPPLIAPQPQQFSFQTLPQPRFVGSGTPFQQFLPAAPGVDTLQVQQAGAFSDFLFGPSPGLLGLGAGGAAPAGGVCVGPETSTTTKLPARIDVPTGRGRFTTYKNMGQPVLFRGDLAACKRVRRIGRAVKKSLGGR